MNPSHPVAVQPITAAEAYLGLLASRGIEYLFANGGTDFAPIVEAYARGQALVNVTLEANYVKTS